MPKHPLNHVATLESISVRLGELLDVVETTAGFLRHESCLESHSAIGTLDLVAHQGKKKLERMNKRLARLRAMLKEQRAEAPVAV